MILEKARKYVLKTRYFDLCSKLNEQKSREWSLPVYSICYKNHLQGILDRDVARYSIGDLVEKVSSNGNLTNWMTLFLSAIWGKNQVP